MNALERVISWIAPYDCLVCEREGELLCAWCRLDACPPLPDRCYRCHKISPDSRVCDRCRRVSKLRYVWVITQYDAVAKDLLYKFKFARAKSAAKLIAGYLDERLPYLKADTIITNVPTSTSRARIRGYDQAQLIGKEFAARRGLLFAQLLSRTGQQRQVGATRKQRLIQLENSFLPIKTALIKNSQILVIDDVLTTGATLEACAKVLRTNGAKVVNGAVFAQSK
jgi:competence protein ComFC